MPRIEVKDIIKKSISEHEAENKRQPLRELSICYDLYEAFNSGILNYDNSNFYVLHGSSDIDRAIKLSTIMPSTITLTNLNNVVVQIDHGVVVDPNHYDRSSGSFLSEYEVLCHEPSKGLISNCPNLFTEGIIEYYPNTAYYFMHPDGTTELSKKNTIEAPQGIIDVDPANTANLMAAAISLDIPYIYDVPIEDYEKIVLDNADSLFAFRKFFGKNISKIDWAKPSEQLDFEYELKKGIDDLTTRYKRESLKLKKSLVVGTLTTVLTSLFVFNDYAELLKCISGLSGGAGLIKLVSSVYDYRIEKAQIDNNDFYFLWLLHKKACS